MTIACEGSGERSIDGALWLVEMTVNKCKIDLMNFVGLKKTLKFKKRFLSFGNNKEAGRVLVKPVDDTGPERVFSNSGNAWIMSDCPVGNGFGLIEANGMSEESCWFVNDKKEFIFKDHGKVERGVWYKGGDYLGESNSPSNDISGFHVVCWLYWLIVYKDESGADVASDSGSAY